MLVFTRKLGETIVIGDGIEVRVLRVGRDGVRLGVVAPPTIAVHRHEIYEAVRTANRSAASSRPAAAERTAERLRRRLTRVAPMTSTSNVPSCQE
jgi:carbon storage regulator